MILLDGLVAIHRQCSKACTLPVGEEFPQGICQGLLIILDRQQVVPTALENLLGNRGLTADGIDRDDTSLERQRIEQGLDRGNLVALAARMLLGQTQAAGRGVGADRVQRGVMAIPGTASNLAVDVSRQSRNVW